MLPVSGFWLDQLRNRAPKGLSRILTRVLNIGQTVKETSLKVEGKPCSVLFVSLLEGRGTIRKPYPHPPAAHGSSFNTLFSSWIFAGRKIKIYLQRSRRGATVSFVRTISDVGNRAAEARKLKILRGRGQGYG
jgi:hypothetical protein